VEKYSPFDQMQRRDFFGQIKNSVSKNGTMIFIYNLKKWDKEVEYALDWDAKDCKDGVIPSKRPRL